MKKMCSRQGWTRPYEPIFPIALFCLQCYTQAKGELHEEGRIETAYGAEGNGKIYARIIDVWTRLKQSNSVEERNKGIERGVMKAESPLGRTRCYVYR